MLKMGSGPSSFDVDSGWSRTIQLTEGSDVPGLGPQVAIGPDGSAVAVWTARVGPRRGLGWSRLEAPSRWSDVSLIHPEHVRNVRDPQVAVGPDASVIAVWIQEDDDETPGIWSSRFDPDWGWGSVSVIDAENAERVWGPQLVIGSDGSAVAVWLQRWRVGGVRRWGVWSNHYAVDWGWGAASVIDAGIEGRAKAPQIAIGPQGHTIAVWSRHDEDDADVDIWWNHFEAGSSWGTAAPIETPGDGRAQHPWVAVGPNGSAVCVWVQNDSDALNRNNIWSSRRHTGSGLEHRGPARNSQW